MINSFNVIREALADQGWVKVTFDEEVRRMKEKWKRVEGVLSVVELRHETTTREGQDVRRQLEPDLQEAWEKVRSLEESLNKE